MSKTLTVNFHFTYPNMAGGTKSCRLLAEEMQRQGADVVIYHPDDPHHHDRHPIKKLLIRIKKAFKKKPKSGSMHHHLETCEVPVISVKGNKIKQNHVRKADFDIGNFWLQRAWMYEWQGKDFVPGLYVRGHAAGGEENLGRAYSADGVTITHATWLERMLKETYKAKHVILAPNGVDRNQFAYRPRKKNQQLCIGFQYAQDPRKGADTMLAAFQKIIQRDPSIKLISFGSCEVGEKHKNLVPNWTHECRPAYERIAEMYHQTDCWILSSTSEGLPMPPLEAAACGTPVVATDCGGPEDYVTEGESGYIVPIGDPDAMADAIGKIIFMSDEDWQNFSIKSYENTLAFEWSTSAAHLIAELTKYRDTH